LKDADASAQGQRFLVCGGGVRPRRLQLLHRCRQRVVMALALVFQPDVFVAPRRLEVVVSVGHLLTEFGCIGQAFGVDQAGPGHQPVGVALTGFPFGGIALQVVCGVEVVPSFA
jgi:hypothetical protein